MFFIGLTSAYIVKKGADVASGHWQFFKMPIQFYASTIVIILSSVTILMAKKYFFKGNKQSYQIAMLASSILGTVFLVLQYLGWKQLVNIGIYVGGSMSHANGSFFYVISGAHALHILGGLLIMYWMTLKSFVRQKNVQSKVGIELISIYWHFVDILWVYLFAMLLFF
jgi:cytochrome c oxidase subunit 3